MLFHIEILPFFPFFFSFTLDDFSIPEFELNLENGEKNGIHGIFAFVSPSFVYGDEQLEVVTIYKQVNDIYDVRDPSNSIKMNLLPDGSGVLVEEPAMPYFMTSQIQGLYSNSCANAEMEAALVTNHTILVNAMKKNPSRVKNKFVLHFSGNKRCKMGHMNPEIGSALRGHINVTRSSVINKNGDQIPFTHVTIRFMAVVQTSERKLLKDDVANGTNIEDLLAGMSMSMQP